MKTITTFFLALFLTINLSYAQSNQRKQQFNIDKNTLAIQGYDPLAYFTVKKALEGKKEFRMVYDGITYHFATAQNLALFKASPTKYEPQFGGWCAYAMGKNCEKVEIDPETFKVVDGKLYLFYNKFFNNTLKDWNKNEAALKQKAEQNWAKLN